MAASRLRDRLLLQEDLNFLVTNRIPRRLLTQFMGWFSQRRHPWVVAASMAVWRRFTDLDLSDARKQRFDSLHDCFTRELRPGARVIDPSPAVLSSPCDAVVGACGQVEHDLVLQAKGSPYRLRDLFGRAALAAPFEGGSYITLRLRSNMYHRFHAPCDARIDKVVHLAGDTWNVNPIALKRIERLFCRNERAVISLRLPEGKPLALVAVAAILVASIRLHAPALRLHQGWTGPDEIDCDVPVHKGQELGWFEHGSTIIVFAPPGFSLAPGIGEGCEIRMGQALLQRPAGATP